LTQSPSKEARQIQPVSAGESLKVVRAEFSSLGQAVLHVCTIELTMQARPSLE